MNRTEARKFSDRKKGLSFYETTSTFLQLSTYPRRQSGALHSQKQMQFFRQENRHGN